MNFSPSSAVRLPIIPSLRELHLGLVIFLDPLLVASPLIDPGEQLRPPTSLPDVFIRGSGLPNLEQISLVDAYRESIWGPRLRRSDIETAAVSMYPTIDSNVGGLQGHLALEAAKKRIQSLVICAAQTERIMGGDRVEDHRALL